MNTTTPDGPVERIVSRQRQPVTMQTRWRDGKGREWQIVEKLPFGRNLCTTVDRRLQGEWTHKEIRHALSLAP